MNKLEIKELYDSLANEFHSIQNENEIYDKTFIITFNYETINQVIISNTFSNLNWDTLTNRLFILDLQTYIDNKDSIMEYLIVNHIKIKRWEEQIIDNEQLYYLYNEYIWGKAWNYQLDSSPNFIFRVKKIYSDDSFVIFQAPSLYILDEPSILNSLYNNTFEINDFFTYR